MKNRLTCSQVIDAISDKYKQNNISKNERIEAIKALLKANISNGEEFSFDSLTRLMQCVNQLAHETNGTFFRVFGSKLMNYRLAPVAQLLLDQYVKLLHKKVESYMHCIKDFGSDKQVYLYNGALFELIMSDEHQQRLKIFFELTKKTPCDIYVELRLMTSDEQVRKSCESQQELEEYERALHDAYGDTCSSPTSSHFYNQMNF